MVEQIDANTGLAKVVRIIAAIISIIVFISIPAGFFSIAYKYESEEIYREATLGADIVSETIYSNPDLWKFNEHRLVGALKQVQSRIYVHQSIVTDENGKTIAMLPAELDHPVFSRSVELTDGEKIVGKITVAESMRPLLFDTAMAGLYSSILALAIYFALKILPLRALNRVIRHLDESQKLLREEIQAKELALVEARDMGITMRHQAQHDALTNLPNRVLLHDRLQQAILICRREKKTLALIMMDLDRFKSINDTLGHHSGDLVLQQVAKRLLYVLRVSDTVARLGGDEFAILLPSVNGHTGVVITAKKIIEAVKEPLKLENQMLHISASLGIVLFPEHGDDPAALMRCADVAMYSAKNAQTGFEIYNVEQDLENTRKIYLQNDLRGAIEGNQLILHYQPKIDLATNRVCSVEALVRWQHPTEGLVFPDDFVPIAEQNSLIKLLTREVLRMALRQLSKWKTTGLALPVAINISGVNLQDPTFSDQVVEILGEFSVSPSMIEMEITETAIMEDPMSAIKTVNKLRDIGIVISIDDFGTGYSSMAYLKKLLVAKIKVDKSFVMDMAKNANDLVIVRSTIELAHNLGLTVIAEGVESEEILEQLRSLGCDVAQGYYMSRPISADKLNEWLEKSIWGIDNDS
ncbi:MAG: EAL domain-containing protein [Gallionella sp.]